MVTLVLVDLQVVQVLKVWSLEASTLWPQVVVPGADSPMAAPLLETPGQALQVVVLPKECGHQTAKDHLSDFVRPAAKT